MEGEGLPTLVRDCGERKFWKGNVFLKGERSSSRHVSVGASPDNGQLGEGHGGQRETVREADGVHGAWTLGCVALQALSHIFLF